jgi:hypothetical protein
MFKTALTPCLHAGWGTNFKLLAMHALLTATGLIGVE